MRATESIDASVESAFRPATIGGRRTSDTARAESLARVRPAPATFVLAGEVPDPLLSSRSRGWNGITVELHSFQELDSLVQPADHVIAIHLAGAVNLRRIRHGCSRVRKMGPGDVTITPVGPPVRWTQSSQSLVILLRLTPAYVRAIASDECAIDPDRFEIRDEFATRDAKIEALGRRCLAALELEGSDSLLYVDTLTYELTLHLLRRYTVNGVNQWPKARLSPHKLRRAIEHIDENLGKQVSLAGLASIVALSPGHFAHAFREATGVAPHRYMIERRVERAKTLLRQSDLPITEIAHRIGCSSHSHFSVLFHRVTGLTPRQFRALD
jgi:AraC family transcriptional regulator